MPSSTSVSVFGASGYAGALAAALLQRHPRFELRTITSRSDVGRRLDELYPRHRVPLEMVELDLDRHGDVDAAIVAYPHHAAAPVVAGLRERGVRVIDLSADFRLTDLPTYEQWYGPHAAPQLFGSAAYGLPELGYRERIAEADVVANPGCFPTAALLGLAPLARAGLVDDVVIDAKTGVSGAGRAATEKTHFVTVDENVAAYGLAGHRHAPEIDQELAVLGAEVTVTFVPHLLPLDQGELISAYVRPSRDVTEQELLDLYAEHYAGERFVELTGASPGVRDVRETNIARIKVTRDARSGRVLVFAAIDNLWKGTSSQAVQNLNLMFGYDEAEGLS
ncbi:N-acetyl-gamma-glutamyl-phosphate reductase [Conexibacter woesei]|uniref:N-acetyl-gamma-glutamyl-phosphate reductase n=1 Tax=Conexibacter woesei (strain DSM 14684 / CCUG 47730 / CIP 108061 / JCM 11494 / NBRC 100937 / ID131577) TaxID=469383 RepID=D3F0H2_CONWI|nr:N-acetyl-gamma-glutamyl-phosphate reductase [Conexibacter woesei]ADB52032.1 N-acetyl-gamma-glutamyl-phosphate reductase [Conexibacter woesei DSM 14684]